MLALKLNFSFSTLFFTYKEDVLKLNKIILIASRYYLNIKNKVI